MDRFALVIAWLTPVFWLGWVIFHGGRVNHGIEWAGTAELICFFGMIASLVHTAVYMIAHWNDRY